MQRLSKLLVVLSLIAALALAACTAPAVPAGEQAVGGG